MSKPTNEQEYVDAIVERPDDDDLRLAYASFIAPYRPAVGELVQLQVERSQRERALGKRRSRPTSRELDLIAKIDESATRTLRKYIARSGKRYEYHRGFVAMVRVDAGVFLEYTDWLFRMAPIQHIDFEPGNAELEEVLASPALARLHSIGFRGWKMGDAGARAVAACPHLERCQWLELSINDIGEDGFEALIAAPRTRSMLVINTNQNNAAPVPTITHDSDGHSVREPRAAWVVALEDQYGPTPWLHPEDNATDRYQAYYLVDAGILPVK